MKVDLLEFIKSSEDLLGRELTEKEVSTIKPCNCPRAYCPGWTGEFQLDPLFVFKPGRTEV